MREWPSISRLVWRARRMPRTHAAAWSSPAASPSRSPEELISGRSARKDQTTGPPTQRGAGEDEQAVSGTHAARLAPRDAREAPAPRSGVGRTRVDPRDCRQGYRGSESPGHGAQAMPRQMPSTCPAAPSSSGSATGSLPARSPDGADSGRSGHTRRPSPALPMRVDAAGLLGQRGSNPLRAQPHSRSE